MRRAVVIALAAALALLAAPAIADPGSVAVVLSSWIGTSAAVAVTVAVYTYGSYALAAYAVHSSIQARNKAKRAAAAAKAAYNAGLQDRNLTALTATPGRRVIYGRADTGGDIVAIFTTDKTSTSLNNFRGGGTVTKPDAYKHILIVWAAHQCQAIHDIKIDGVPVGALDANGWATSPQWRKSDPRPTANGQLVGTARTHTLPAGSTIISVALITGAPVGPGESGAAGAHTPISSGPGGWSFAGTTLTLPNSVTVAGFEHTPGAVDIWDISYSSDDVDGTSALRVRHHLGAPDQAADAELVALLPGKWTANHRLRGRCYSWITLDLERAQFQGGPPGITADISGALLLDPRTGVTAWTDNPALCAYDFLRRVEGMGVTAAEVEMPSVIAAANACDVSTLFTVGSVSATGPRYTCNGAFIAGQAKEAVLIDICESMAGWASYGGAWRILAGAWTPPVMDLTDADLAGSISIVQAGEPSSELFNSVRGQYVPAGSGVPADIETYSNATFVTADGRALFTDVELPFTNSRARAKNLSRIKVEQSRAGLVIFFPAQLRAWPLQAGDRVRVTSAEYGFTAKTFRVTDWQFGLRSPVGLTLQEDAEDIYDLADAATADPTPNTDLPDPWLVPALGAPTAQSGTAQLQRLGDGTIISRVLVSWPRSTAAYMEGGRIEAVWREGGSTVLHTAYADGLDTEMYLTGVRDGTQIIIELTAINAMGARSAPWALGHLVLGKTEAPSAPADFAAAAAPGGALATWTPCPDADYLESVLLLGADVGSAVPIWQGAASSYLWLQPLAGTYTLWLRHRDTSGNTSAPATAIITLAASTAAGNLVDVSWWRQDASIPWTAYGEYNRIVNTSPSGGADLGVPGPRGGNDTVWYCKEVTHDAGAGGGWDADAPLLDPTQNYRFVVPVRRLSGTAGTMFWGPANVENLDGSANANPYFVGGVRPAYADRWYLLVGYLYAAGSVGNSSDNAGVYDCRTGAKVFSGASFRFKAGDGGVRHRALHDSASNDAEQIFGRPVINLVDGTEPSLRDYFEAGAVLNSELLPLITAAQADASAAIAAAADAQATADGKVTTFVQASAPAAEGVGDLWIDSDDGNKLYRWSGAAWVQIRDTGIGQALTNASNAQATADGKIVSYYQASPPTAGAVGDLWTDTDDGNKLYRWSGAAWVSVRDAGIAQALADASAAQATADGKVELFYQPGAPAGQDGDIWFDTDDGNKQYVKVGGSWVLAADTRIGLALTNAAGAQATADGKVTTFFAASEPTAAAVGDLWFNATDGRVKRWSGSSWVTQSVIGAGDVGTGNLADQAATDVTVVTFSAITVSNIA